jgi:transposase
LQNIIIEKIETCEIELKYKIYCRQDRNYCFCNHCDSQLGAVHEWKDRIIRGPPVGAFVETIIYLKQLRAHCYFCNDQVRSAKVDFVHPNFQNMTMALCEYAGRLMEEITCEAVGRLLRFNPKTMWNLDQVRMRMMRPILSLPENIDLSFMSADEVHFRSLKKINSMARPEIKFVTTLVCYKESKILSTAMGRDSKALKTCIDVLSNPQKLSINFFAVDMHDPFIKVIKKYCPDAEICIDRFHLIQNVNKAFDWVRKHEFSLAKKQNDEFQIKMLSPHRRFVLVEIEKKLEKKDLKMLDRLKELNKNILNGMILVEHFHAILDKKEVSEFRKSLTLWYRLVRESGLQPFRKLASTIRKYRLNIESYIRSKLTTAVSEGLNNKIKVLKRMGYGYTNEESFQLKILQRCGFLNSNFINTTGWFWQIPKNLALRTPF